MNNKEAIEKLTNLLNSYEYAQKNETQVMVELNGMEAEALDLAIKALEFQDKFIDIIAQAVINSGCDSLEEFCEKCGINVKGAENETSDL